MYISVIINLYTYVNSTVTQSRLKHTLDPGLGNTHSQERVHTHL